jgi:hypothetical protein
MFSFFALSLLAFRGLSAEKAYPILMRKKFQNLKKLPKIFKKWLFITKFFWNF